jgi:predicted transcriptional regulator
MPNSCKSTPMKCPNCGRSKSISPNRLLRTHSLGCICSDGVSYPNKFIYSLLNQINIEYNPEYTFEWSDKKRYDIYIPSLNCIIENHGEQHYDNSFKNIDSRTLEEEQENDKQKQELALINSIKHYIVLDCRQSNMEWIQNSVLNSILPKMFDLSHADWIQCHEFACSNLVNIAADLWNRGMGVYAIVKEMHLSDTTIVRYLKQAAECGLCDYTKENSYKRMGEAEKGANHHMARLTVQLTDKLEVVKLWKYMTEAESELNISMKQISACCYETRKMAGGYKWRFLYDVTKRDGTIIPGAITLALITEEDALAQLSIVNKL